MYQGPNQPQYPQQPGRPQYPQQSMQPPQQPPKKKMNATGCGIVAAIVLVIATCGLVNAAMHNSTSISSTTSTTVATTMLAQVTKTTPTAATTTTVAQAARTTPIATTPTAAQPSQPVTRRLPVLGSPISDFIARYGQPTSQTNGQYLWMHGALTVDVVNIQRVAIVSYTGQDTNGWNTLQAAIDACVPFLPGDAQYKRTVEIHDGQGNRSATERVYFSASLASQFPASAFTDEHGNTTTAGMFGVAYHYDITDPHHLIDCDPQVGMEAE